MKKLLSLALCAGSFCLTAAAPLFDNGKSVWKIVIPSKATEVDAFAAKEFSDAVRKISGVQLPVVKNDAPTGKNLIVIGSLKTSPQIRKMAGTLKLKESAQDAIAVYTLNDNLYLAGNNARCATYAVYHFLRSNLGARWFWPTDDGEFMPKKSSYTIQKIAYNHQTPFAYRAMTPVGNHGDPVIESFVFRMYQNAGMQNRKNMIRTGVIRRVGTHSVCVEPRDFEKHPDWFAMVGGKRLKTGIAGCWSNPEFTKYVVDRHVKWIKQRKADLLCAFPADVTQRCECKDCVAIHPDMSTRWYIYYGKLIKEIQKQCPDVRAAGIAYQEFRAIPKIPVKNLEYVEYCHYNRCYIHPIDSPTCLPNKKAIEHIKEWQKKSVMGIYGYEYDIFNTNMYLPMWNIQAKAAKTFRDMKMVRYKTEYPARRQGKNRPFGDYMPIRLTAYIFGMTSWNPDADVDALIKDFCQYVYGAGADNMYKYHTNMAKYYEGIKTHITYFLQNPDGCSIHLLTPVRIRTCRNLLMAAEKAAQTMPDKAARARALKEIANDKLFFEAWEKIYNNAQQATYSVGLPKCPVTQDFDKLDNLPVTSKKGKHNPTDIRMFWSNDGLHFRIIAEKADLKNKNRGKTGRDNSTFWGSTAVEIFVDLNDGYPFRHLAFNLAGGFYDATGNDTSWNPKWSLKVKTDEKNDRWVAEVFLPFKEFGGKVPKDGASWKINVIRAGKPEACAFPAPVYRDLDLGAMIIFSNSAKIGKNLTYISRHAQHGDPFYNGSRNLFAKFGWQTRQIKGVEELKNTDFSKDKLIVCSTYQLKMPKEEFQQKILPAVKNGTVLFLWAYYWIDWLPRYLEDPTWKVGYRDFVHKTRRYTWFHPALQTKPNPFRNITTPPGVLTPANPEKWEVLAKQMDAKGVEKPAIVCRPYGKGLIVIASGLYGNIFPFFDKIFEYNKVIKR